MVHTEDDHTHLREISKHLLYEINQLEYKGKKLDCLYANPSSEEDIIHSVFESFLIHGRNIYEFLFTGKTRKDDIRANDFKEDTNYQIPNPIDPFLKQWARTMIDKRLMHLTEFRLTIKDTDHEWEINELFQRLYKQLIFFYRWVPDEHICSDLKKKKEWSLKNADDKKLRREPLTAPWSSTIVMGTAGPSMPVIVPPK